VLQVLANLGFLLGLAFSGLVVGFCLGGGYGHFWGAHAGHGLGDLGYLFRGAWTGALIGLGTAVWGTLRWSSRARWLVVAGALVAGGVAAGATWVLVSSFGGG
jgi:hypothetical protein